MLPGESINIENYTLTYDNMSHAETPSKRVVSATISIYNEDKLLGKLTPEVYFHEKHQQPVTEVAIRSTLVEDLYVILVKFFDDLLFEYKTDLFLLCIDLGKNFLKDVFGRIF